MPYSILIFLTLSSFVLSVHAQNSFELMCRNQAKEIAAETYKNCITENRQTHVEQIRKEYQQKLSDLKSHYDGELKKVSNGQTRSSVKNMIPTEIKPDRSATTKRASGARELPEKKMTATTIKTEVIDFSNAGPAIKEQSSLDTTEIVEIPVE